MTVREALSPGRVINYALGCIWLTGAIIQTEMTRNGLAYDHGYVFAGIMGFGALAHFLMPSLIKRRS